MDAPVLLARAPPQGQHGRRVVEVQAELVRDGVAQRRAFQILHQRSGGGAELDRAWRERTAAGHRRQIRHHLRQEPGGHEMRHHDMRERIGRDRRGGKGAEVKAAQGGRDVVHGMK